MRILLVGNACNSIHFAFKSNSDVRCQWNVLCNNFNDNFSYDIFWYRVSWTNAFVNEYLKWEEVAKRSLMSEKSIGHFSFLSKVIRFKSVKHFL